MKPRNSLAILLVEDNPDDLELSLRVLRKHGLTEHIRIVRDGAAALDAVTGTESHDFGLMLLNTRLPKLHGTEVLRALKASPASRRMPVIMMVSSEQEREFVERQGAQADGYVTKPLAFDKLAHAVHALGMCCSVCSGRGKDVPRTMTPAGI